jgi:hypothetical protein
VSAVRATHGAENGDTRAAVTSSRALFVSPHERRDGFWANIRGHVLDLADPTSGLAPTPDDLFVVSMGSDIAWSARRFLRASGLPAGVSVSATWRTQEGLPGVSEIDLTVTVSRRAEAVSAELGAAFGKSVAARSVGKPVVHISFEGVNR